MPGKPVIPEYIPPGTRNVDDDPMGRRRTRVTVDYETGSITYDHDPPPRPPYNDASAPPRVRSQACWRCGARGRWTITVEDVRGSRLCSSCAVKLSAVAAARELGQRLGGPVVAAVAELAGALAIGEGSLARRRRQKPVKAAILSPGDTGGSRRGRPSRKSRR